MANRESDLSIAPEAPQLQSEYERKFIYSRGRIALALLLAGMFLAYPLRMSFLGWFAFAVPFVVFVVYLKFTLAHLYQWEFGEETFSRKNILKPVKRTFRYSDISTFQERQRFGTQSRREFIPNYEEMNIWMKNKQSFAFDAIDFVNYEDMKARFLERCEAFSVEMAPYRE